MVEVYHYLGIGLKRIGMNEYFCKISAPNRTLKLFNVQTVGDCVKRFIFATCYWEGWYTGQIVHKTYSGMRHNFLALNLSLVLPIAILALKQKL